ncbi:protein HEG-like isoform X2 [Heptranchias perlo]|uniref:protein HEG-like isoform X2 n=1 Tax=Heptranchias perlo TaxID=212740 RepID=UPI003559A4AC
MAMMRGVTSACLLSLISYIAAQPKDTSSTVGPSDTETTLVMSTSTILPVADTIKSSPSYTTSLNSTTVGPQASPTTELPFTSKQNLINGNNTSASSSVPEGGSMSSTHLVPNTTISTSTPPISMPSETSSSTEKNVSTTEMQASFSSAVVVNMSAPINNIIASAPTPTVATTKMTTNTTVNITQTSTFNYTTIAASPNNASTSIPATSGDMNTILSTAVSTNETSTVVTPKTTPTNTSATTEAITNDTMPANVTMPTTGASETVTVSTEVSSSSWSTAQPPESSTTRPTDHCANVICPEGTTCVNLFQSYICQCPPGLSNQGNSCGTARIFPGVLHLLNVSFTDGMNEINSKAFFDTATEIEEVMRTVFKDDSFYQKSVVKKLEKGSVNAFIDNIFALSSPATEESVLTNIKVFIQNCTACGPISRKDSYVDKSLCSANVCDSITSKCKPNNGIVTCDCLPGYYKFSGFDRSCKACSSGFKLENGKCVTCPYGYGGFNCDKSYLLAVVVISCVLGGILLLVLLALIAMCLRSKNGTCSSSSSSHDYVMWPKSEMPKIPRATMHWDGNQLEMQENGSTSSLTDIHRDGGRMPEKSDDLKTFKGKQQSRYTYLCQGQENPYYVSDEKKPEYL